MLQREPLVIEVRSDPPRNDPSENAYSIDLTISTNYRRITLVPTEVMKDDTKAAAWFRKAANQGHAGAQFNLAVVLENGCGAAQADAEARAWYEKAAAQGHLRAQVNLGSRAHARLFLTGHHPTP